jgi:hypothetical protein
MVYFGDQSLGLIALERVTITATAGHLEAFIYERKLVESLAKRYQEGWDLLYLGRQTHPVTPS